MATPVENMEAAAETFRERNKAYGDNYLRFGNVMHALFPNGVLLDTPEKWNRFCIFITIIAKASRYANDDDHPHLDSIHDLGVYAFMLESLDQAAIERVNAALQADMQ
jgi:hypothetical protein